MVLFCYDNTDKKERIIDQLLDAVGYLHKQGIIHNDLKPANFIVRRSDNSLVMVDFDLADHPAQYLLKNRGCTFTYAAPELVDSNISDCRSDIYSIGILISLICGSHYRYISNKCLQRNPDKRFKDIQELRKKWNKRSSVKRFKVYILIGMILLINLAAFYFHNTNLYQPGKIEPSVTTDRLNVNNQDVLSHKNNDTEYQDNLARNNQYDPKISIPSLNSTQAVLNQEHPSKSYSQILNQINKYNHQLLEETITSIHESRYSEFGLALIRNFSDKIIKNYDRYISESRDKETIDIFNTHRSVFLSNLGTQLYNEMNKMPSLLDDGTLSEQELEFYMELLATDSPFRSYQSTLQE